MLDFQQEDGGLWETSSSIASLGNRDCKIYILQEADASSPTSRQLAVLDEFISLEENRIATSLSDCALDHLEEVEEDIDLEEEGIDIDPQNIARHFRVDSILVPTLGQLTNAFVFASADCEWEPEHGMHVLFRDGEIIWCGNHGMLPHGAKWEKLTLADSEEAQIECLQALIAD